MTLRKETCDRTFLIKKREVLTCSEERTDKVTSPHDLYTTEVYMLETSSSDGNKSSENQTREEELQLIKTE